MPNSPTTVASSASDTQGSPIPLSYGYQWMTGKRVAYYELQDTGDDDIDYTRVGIWLQGHGEWDGCNELWINDTLTWQSELDDPSEFHFHRGSDSTIGAGLAPSSVGPDQGVDTFWSCFPPAIQPLAYSRIAYYAIKRKQPIPNQTNDHQDDPTQWGDINPIGLWRALRCRLFDDEGNMAGYAFTTNPAWHWVDVLLRRKIFPDYGLDLNNGPDALTAAIQNRFDWGTIYQSAQYFDQILSNGNRRFIGSYAFSSQTTLQACLEQILLCCRSFQTEYAGKLAIVCDMPRSSSFTFSRNHILPGSFEATDAPLNTGGNRYISTFRDLLVPACSAIASITCPDHGSPEVTTTTPHPCIAGDRIAIGGTNTIYDGEWVVKAVPAVIDPGTVDAVYPSTMTLISRGENYPSSVGAGGSLGLLDSRFTARYPEFWHKNNMLARGAIGNGIARQREKVKQALDFATSTYDQVDRITCYERDRQLGVDQSPYITPPNVKLRTSMFAKDVDGKLVAAIRPGDHVTLDSTVDFQYAGEYEVLDPLAFYPPTCKATGAEGAIALSPDPNSGEIGFTLGPYNEAIMYDTSDPEQAGWPSVPGSYPGNDNNFTGILLASGGTFAFFTGALPSGQVFQLPSTGFPPANALAWAGPQGYQDYNHPMHVIALCDPGMPNRKLVLQYEDGDGDIWPGDVNFACVTWLSSDAAFSFGGFTWIQFTLAGGEIVLFGQGVVADGTTIDLPSGFSTAKMFAVAYPHDGVPTGNDAHGVAAFVDSSQVVHLNYEDGEGNIWHGNAAVLVFAWQDNMGTVVTETVGGVNWMHCPLSDGTVFGVGCGLGMTNGENFGLPAAAGDGSTLQAIAGPSGFQIVDHPAHGVKACYLDGNNDVVIEFEDGTDGDIWYGTADVFGLFCTPASAPPTLVVVSPPSASIPSGALQQFTADVQNNTNQAVTWSVDGIPGGNVTVGTIDASGNYGAPSISGTHTVTATSVADPSASGSATVNVYGSVAPAGSILVDAQGNIIYLNGQVIYVE